MNLLELKAADGQEAWEKLATDLDSSVAYISQLAHGHRNPSRAFAMRMIEANRKLTLPALLPEMYGPEVMALIPSRRRSARNAA